MSLVWLFMVWCDWKKSLYLELFIYIHFYSQRTFKINELEFSSILGIDIWVFPVSPSINLTFPSHQYQVAHISTHAMKKYWCESTRKHTYTFSHITTMRNCSMRSHVLNCLWYIINGKEQHRSSLTQHRYVCICLSVYVCEQAQMNRFLQCFLIVSKAIFYYKVCMCTSIFNCVFAYNVACRHTPDSHVSQLYHNF